MTPKKISTTRLRKNLSDALASIGHDDVLVVTRRGKDEVAIVDLDRFEDLLAASDPEYLKSIKEAREQYKKGEVFTMEEVFGDID